VTLKASPFGTTRGSRWWVHLAREGRKKQYLPQNPKTPFNIHIDELIFSISKKPFDRAHIVVEFQFAYLSADQIAKDLRNDKVIRSLDSRSFNM
jgi:hypothetical protein